MTNARRIHAGESHSLFWIIGAGLFVCGETGIPPLYQPAGLNDDPSCVFFALGEMAGKKLVPSQGRKVVALAVTLPWEAGFT